MPFKATTQDTFGLRCIHVIAPIVGKQSVFILLQNENGPCPLIALANVLALRGIVDWSVVPKRAGSEPGSHIDVCDVLNHIGTMVNELSSKHTCSEAEKTFVLDEALRALPGLVQGMDLNIRFRNHKDYEAMASLTVFDILNISLVHGWVIDKNDTELQSLIGSKSYNQLMDDLLQDSVESEHDHSTANTNTSVAGKVRNFLTNGQLTFTGMFELIENVSDGDNVVFFRSNHFSVLTKHGEYLYTLVTDVGYADHPDIVWERIVDLDGDTVLCDAEFTSAKEKYRNQVAHICENQDAALAYQLQMQEQKKAEETRRSNITREAPTQRLHQGNISRPRLDMNRKSDNCAIL